MFDWQDDRTPPFAHFGLNTSYAANSTIVINATTSSDNVGIANYTWTLDGQAVCWGIVFSHVIAGPGQYVLNLTVRDAWGNAGTYERTLNVVPADQMPSNDTGSGGMDSSTAKMLLMFLLVPVFIFIAILAVARTRRSR
jgi:hypothetical protein